MAKKVHSITEADTSVTIRPADARCGEPVPWSYGPYRVVIQRRVTEEEQISIECYEETKAAARETFGAMMDSMREHMIAHNERVVLVHQGKMALLERQIEARAQELRELDEEIEAKKAAR